MIGGDFIKRFTSKQIIVIVIIGIIIFLTIVTYFYKTVIKSDNKNYEDNSVEKLNNNEENLEEEIKTNEILIDITGCVKNKGIVILKEGSRILDAIDAAGGETDDADLNKVNLAYTLQDGEKLYIPSKNEKMDKEYVSTESGNNIITEEASGSNNKKDDIININTATKEQLETLDGIGESTANKIIKYREEKGKFKTIEDIKNVPGIGNAKFENIKDKIKVK